MISETIQVEEDAVSSESIDNAREEQAVLSAALPDKPVVVNEAYDSLVRLDIEELWNYRELLQFLTWRDIKVRYKQTVMGATWAVIQPLFMMLVFAVFFGIFVGVPTDGMPFLIFYYCGLLPWTFFSTAVSQGSMSLVSNANLVTKVYFPRILIPMATVGAGLIDLLIASVILIGMTLLYGVSITWSILMLPFFMLLTVALALGLGIWLAAFTVKYRDIRHALPFVLQVWMFLTPIIYPLSVIPAKWQWVLFLNPMTGIVEGIRASLSGHPMNWSSVFISTVITTAILLVALRVFRLTDKSMADLI